MKTGESETRLDSAWRFLVRHREGFLDAEGQGIASDIRDLGIEGVEKVSVSSIYYLLGHLKETDCERLKNELLADPITQECEVTLLGSLRGDPLSLRSGQAPGRRSNPYDEIASPRHGGARNDASIQTIEVAYHPGVRDPVEDSIKKGALDLGIRGITAAHTAKAYTIFGKISPRLLDRICEKLLVNATIQQVVTPENLKQILVPKEGTPIPIETVHLLEASDTVLQRVSMDHQLSLNLEEMRAIQAYFRAQKREPTLIELETLAQTWSEHCKHKTLRGTIVFTEEIDGKIQKRVIENLLKNTIMRATKELNKPWCISVFEDNSGVIRFDESHGVAFKVETHNHPSALEPFGGASTGIGGVIRDILGTGRGAKPIASTDIFCFAPPDMQPEEIPPGVLHPRRVMKGVVAGVKDYGNKMGIPTVNGAVLFDRRFAGNPLVYCGNIGLLPLDKVTKKVTPGMQIVVAGGRTGRDGIHGATFSSLSLTQESEVISSHAVQIGDPITEKKLSDALLEARDQDLFSAVTDCGAGGLSSAVGEMGAACGARVHLERVPLKYKGLTPTEIWISESQERMVLAVAVEKLEKLIALFRKRGVEATAIGEFTNTGKLELFFQSAPTGELAMDFLHEGVPQVPRPARWVAPALQEPVISPSWGQTPEGLTPLLLQLLSRWDTCSKEWIIRQYDHEVQGGSVVKPFTGPRQQGPSDAAVVRPRLDSLRGIVVGNGINFRYGDLDPYQMAILNVEEAIRQIIATGGTLDEIALLDNFCWGDPTVPTVLGSLVRAAFGCYDAAKAFGTPFISGKDSLHNEYRVGEKTIQIPGTLLISAIGVIPDVTKTITLDAKKAGDHLYLAGLTKKELGGSAYYDLHGTVGASVPKVDLAQAPALLRAVEEAIAQGFVVAAHDCSEGGLGVAVAEISFAGGLGLTLDLKPVAVQSNLTREDEILFSESPTRFLLEVPPEKSEAFQRLMGEIPCLRIGEFCAQPIFRVLGLQGKAVVETDLEALHGAWAQPFQGW